MDHHILQRLRDAEESHLRPEVRSDLTKLADILDDSFTEIGASGNLYNKQDVLQLLKDKPQVSRGIEQFTARRVALDTYLTTYIIKTDDPQQSQTRVSRRSTIWQDQQGALRMLFHQGTPANL